MNQTIAFIGGGNMASAILGGLLRQGMAPAQLMVVEPLEEARQKLAALGLVTWAEPTAALAQAHMVVWAVKPQIFQDAAHSVRNHTAQALHVSVAAGIRSAHIAQWLGSERIIRAMPNTPALIGKGMTALFARPAVNAAEKAWAERVLRTTGDCLWLDQEDHLDAVTALSGSGPAYMFYFMEAMVQAGTAMGLTAAQAHQLTVATFIGAGELAQRSDESPETLRQRVTSKGGTTFAAITSMEQSDIKARFIQALWQAHQRSQTLGQEFGGA